VDVDWGMKKDKIVAIIIISISVLVIIVDRLGPFGSDIILAYLILAPFWIWAFWTLVVYRFTGSGINFGYRLPRGTYDVSLKKDPSHIYRALLHKESGEEYLVNGPPRATFRKVLQDNWPFKKIHKNESWIVRDERGNELTNQTLESCEGVATIELLYGEGLKPVESDKRSKRTADYDNLSTHHDAVTYYD